MRSNVLFLSLCLIVPLGCGGAGQEDLSISLFDGSSLKGWHTNPEPIGHGTGGRWSVEDGAIVGEQDPPDRSEIRRFRAQHRDETRLGSLQRRLRSW